MSSNDLNCSFCGKSRADVKKLISGPGVYICDECVCMSADILGEMPPGGRQISLDALTIQRFLQEYGRPPDSMTIGELLDVYEAQSLILRTKVRKPAKVIAPQLPPTVVSPPGISEQELTAFLSRQYSVPAIDLDSFEIPEDVAVLVPEEVCRKHKLIPVNLAGVSLIIAMADPSNIYAVDDVKFITNYNVEIVLASESAIMAAVNRHWPPPH